METEFIVRGSWSDGKHVERFEATGHSLSKVKRLFRLFAKKNRLYKSGWSAMINEIDLATGDVVNDWFFVRTSSHLYRWEKE